jgi:hypothetical protein
MDADAFDFLSMAPGSGFDGFGAGIAEASDFTGVGVVGVVVVVWLRRGFVRRDVGENNFVIHPAILAQEEKSHSSSLPLFLVGS